MKIKIFVLFLLLISTSNLFAQKPYRVGTTSGNFLEIGYGSDAIGMGEAYVSVTRGLSSMYWNPAGLGYLENSTVTASIQPWFIDISASMFGVGYVHNTLGTFAFGAILMNYGSEEVTTVALPNGTGEYYEGSDLALNLSYGKKLADWFSFGASVKYVTSKIWHVNASAILFDLGAIVNTSFFSWSDKPGDGLNIGMSISNYGTRYTFDGIDLKESVDILPDEDGNFANIPVKFEVDSWELPVIFRLGFSIYPYMSDNQKILLSVDALHPNNNSESVNVGVQYSLNFPSYGELFFRGGYKALFLDKSEYGLTLGVGLKYNLFDNQNIMIDYAYKAHEGLGNLHSYSISYQF